MSAITTSHIAALFPETALNQARAVEAGLSVSRFNTFRRALPLTNDKLAELLGISESTLLRLSRQPGRTLLPVNVSDRLWRIWNVRRKAAELFSGDVAAADGWLAKGQAAFSGRTPLALMLTEVGAREVETLIGRLEHGIVA